MDGRRCFIRMVDGRTTDGWTFISGLDGYKDGWMDERRRTTLFYKDGWVDGRRCFIRMGGWTDDVVL